MSANPTSPKPKALPINADAIPLQLVTYDQWVGWAFTWDTDRDEWTKVPINVRSGRRASSTDPATWAPFRKVVSAFEQSDFDGIGFVVTRNDPFTGIDLDQCRDPVSGAIDQWALDLVAEFASYTEISPSGTGLRIWVVGTTVGLLGLNDKGLEKAGARTTKAPKIEIYSAERYFTVTGLTLEGSTWR
jgi:putative DNA primase/helicase